MDRAVSDPAPVWRSGNTRPKLHTRWSARGSRWLRRVFMSIVVIEGVGLGVVPCVHAENQRMRYGFGVGAALNLPPAALLEDEFGLAVSASAAMRVQLAEGPLTIRWLRGRLTGLVSSSSWAILPTLTGELCGQIGPLELALVGGAQLFGFARREDETIFAPIGPTAGVRMAIHVADWRIGIRSDIVYLPTQLSAAISETNADLEQSFVFLSWQLTVEHYRRRASPSDENFFAPPPL